MSCKRDVLNRKSNVSGVEAYTGKVARSATQVLYFLRLRGRELNINARVMESRLDKLQCTLVICVMEGNHV
jgi:hypothetical protein